MSAMETWSRPSHGEWRGSSQVCVSQVSGFNCWCKWFDDSLAYFVEVITRNDSSVGCVCSVMDLYIQGF